MSRGRRRPARHTGVARLVRRCRFTRPRELASDEVLVLVEERSDDVPLDVFRRGLAASLGALDEDLVEVEREPELDVRAPRSRSWHIRYGITYLAHTATAISGPEGPSQSSQVAINVISQRVAPRFRDVPRRNP
jgi:hypothetical protein